MLALITARGGSKGVPRKNIYPICGKPLLAYSIDAALRSERVTRVVVSTDCQEIALIAQQYGAEVPFIRPSELATDDAPDHPVFIHALDNLERVDGYVPDMVCLLYTSDAADE